MAKKKRKAPGSGPGGARPGAGRKPLPDNVARRVSVGTKVTQPESEAIDARLNPDETRGGWLYRLIRRELKRKKRS